jgi:hypothetical protein
MAVKIRAAKNFRSNPPKRGAIAQLGERIVRNDEVVGSSPTSSTRSINPQLQESRATRGCHFRNGGEMSGFRKISAGGTFGGVPIRVVSGRLERLGIVRILGLSVS